MLNKISVAVEKYKELIMKAERYIRQNPETGYREVKTSKYMADLFEDLYFDDVHASRGAGRYLLALCRFKYLMGKDITGNGFSGFDVPVTDTDREIAIQAVNEVLKL